MAGKRKVAVVPEEPEVKCPRCDLNVVVANGLCRLCRDERDRIMAQVLMAMLMHGVHHAEEQVVRQAYKWADVCMRVGRE